MLLCKNKNCEKKRTCARFRTDYMTRSQYARGACRSVFEKFFDFDAPNCKKFIQKRTCRPIRSSVEYQDTFPIQIGDKVFT